jgi:PAS domain-containing protein
MCVSGPKGRYQFVNEAFARMLGRKLDDVRALDAFQVFAASAHPDEFERERETIGRVARGEIDSYQLEKRLVVDGREHVYQLDAFGRWSQRDDIARRRHRSGVARSDEGTVQDRRAVPELCQRQRPPRRACREWREPMTHFSRMRAL